MKRRPAGLIVPLDLHTREYKPNPFYPDTGIKKSVNGEQYQGFVHQWTDFFIHSQKIQENG
jgi:hypothetical protein